MRQLTKVLLALGCMSWRAGLCLADGNTSEPFALDVQSGVRLANAVEALSFDTAWNAESNVEYRIRVDGTLLSMGSGTGVVDWIPTASGDHILTYEAFADGYKVGSDLSAVFHVAGVDLVDASVVLDADTVHYDGTAHEPRVTVSLNESVLTEGEDYTVSYRDNVGSGVGKVVITGCGAYHDVIERSFEIRAAGLCFLDIQSGTRQAKPIETITFNPQWAEGAGADAVAAVSVDGALLVSDNSAGVTNWIPTAKGTYVLTHTVMTNGIPAGEPLTATFEVNKLLPERPVISPASGQTFDGNLSITMTCASEDATIHYTTNGLTPTMDSPVYKRFRIFEKTVVKAIAFYEDGIGGEMAVAEYAPGKCESPVISPADGTTFDHLGLEVSIGEVEEGIVRYTLDGSDPTSESAAYSGPFTISETTTVKAKAFSDLFLDSSVVAATLTRQWLQVPKPTIDAAAEFSGTRKEVGLSCAMEGVTLHYTLDGTEPTASSPTYAGPFVITNTCTIKVVAVRDDYLDSDVVAMMITKIFGVGDVVNVPYQQFETGGDTNWICDVAVSHDGVASLRSGKLQNNQSITLMTTFSGPGVVSFWWKTSCEDSGKYYDYDHAEFSAEGVTDYLDGISGWQKVERTFTTDGEHVLTWTYQKDDVESAGADCVWIDELVWKADDPLPDLGNSPSVEVVAETLWGSADRKVYDRIVHGKEYDDFRNWANGLAGTSHRQVMDALNAWISFALDQGVLLAEKPTDEDLVVESFESTVEMGKFDFMVSVDGVEIGAAATKENLAKVFGMEGAENLELEAFSDENVEVEILGVEDGCVRFTAGPVEKGSGAFFMRVKMAE